MPSALTNSTSYYVTYDIPRVNVSSDVRQNRVIDGRLKMVAGADCPYEFSFGNKDGKAINLTDMEVKLVFWLNKRFNTASSNEGYSPQGEEIVLTKRMEIIDSAGGEAFVLLSHDDTAKLSQRHSQGGIRWGVFLINQNKELFPMVVTSSGGHFADVVFDYNGLPSYEQIIGS